MSPRIERLATDWKTYLALVGVFSAGIAAFTNLFNQFKDSVNVLRDLPPQAKWIAALILAVIGLFAAIAAWSRRSILLRPDRFIVSADDPEQLKGRTIEIEALVRDCEANPLVFLEGESGTGKSALVRAGLAALLANPAEERQLIPVILDSSSLSWKEGLRIQLSRAIAALSPQDRVQLGATPQFGTDDVFKELAALPSHAARRLLLILDQVDDYLVAHRTYMLRENKVLTASELIQANPNWGALADLVKNGRLHLLLVCRNDIFSRLDSFRFAKVITFTLWRIDQQLISPLLDQVTHDDGKGPVVENPQYGWFQLKTRLLRDLSAGTKHILPIQLAVALDSLRRFRTLTLGEYARNQGARGLERLHIERHLAEIARSRRIDEGALLRGLMLLVTERGQKTQRATRQAFCNAVISGASTDTDLDPVIEHFMRWRILRHQVSDDGEYLLLHHDFLARGIWETHQQANRWAELLRQRGREFKDALTWLQRWRALLPPTAQLRLICARMRGRFSFGENRALAFWSVLRFIPTLAFAASLYVGYVWVDVMRQEQFAEGIFASVGDGQDIDENEARDWASLAAAKEDARIRAVQRGLTKPAVATKLSEKAPILVHTVVGLDPTGQRSYRFALEIVLPTIREYRTKNLDVTIALKFAELLRPGSPVTNTLATALVEQMKVEKHGGGLSSLGEALSSLSEKLEIMEVRPLAAALVELMKTEKDSGDLSSLGWTLGSLSGKLEAKDVQSAAVILVERMKTEKDSVVLSLLGKALDSLKAKLDPKDIWPAADALVERMKTEKDSERLSSLGVALGSLSDKLDSKDIQPAVAALVEQMKIEKDGQRLSLLRKGLDSLNRKFDSKDVQYVLLALIERMKTETDSGVLASLGWAFDSLRSKLDLKDVQLAAGALVERMKIEKDSVVLSSLGRALGSLSERLDAKDVRPAAIALVERMKTEKESGGLYLLGGALSTFCGKLDSKDVQPGAAALVEQMKTENGFPLSSLREALIKLSAKLDAKDAQPLAAELVEMMKPEIETWAFSPLGEALSSLSGKLEAKDVQPLAAVLVERMITENNDRALFLLGETLRGLSGKLDKNGLQPLVATLVERMKTEKDSEKLSSLGNAVGSLSGNLPPRDIQPAAAALVERMKTVEGSESLSLLGDALGSLSATLRPEEAQAAIAILADHWQKGHGKGARMQSWVRLEAVANGESNLQRRIQKYVDLLALPLVVQKNRKTLLDGLESLSGAKFDSDLWRFVEWATDADKGKSMHLELDHRGH